MTTATYTVEGLTCPACMAKIMDGVRLLPQVREVAIDLVRNGPSSLFINSDVTLAPQTVRESVENAGPSFRITGEHAPQATSSTACTGRPLVSRHSRGWPLTNASDPV